jgi:hypothetical protein
MKRRSFIKGIGGIIGTVALASQGVYVHAKEKALTVASNFGWVQAGDVFTIEGVYAVNGELQTFTVVNESSSELTDEMHTFRYTVGHGEV